MMEDVQPFLGPGAAPGLLTEEAVRKVLGCVKR